MKPVKATERSLKCSINKKTLELVSYKLIKDKFEGIINEKTQILEKWSLSK
jgi:hypothetical protein